VGIGGSSQGNEPDRIPKDDWRHRQSLSLAARQRAAPWRLAVGGRAASAASAIARSPDWCDARWALPWSRQNADQGTERRGSDIWWNWEREPAPDGHGHLHRLKCALGARHSSDAIRPAAGANGRDKASRRCRRSMTRCGPPSAWRRQPCRPKAPTFLRGFSFYAQRALSARAVPGGGEPD
jgi:hypothetical protein